MKATSLITQKEETKPLTHHATVTSGKKHSTSSWQRRSRTQKIDFPSFAIANNSNSNANIREILKVFYRFCWLLLLIDGISAFSFFAFLVRCIWVYSFHFNYLECLILPFVYFKYVVGSSFFRFTVGSPYNHLLQSLSISFE